MSHSTNASQRFEPAVAELALPDADLLAGDLAVARCADPFEQWLRWEERANLVGFRMTMDISVYSLIALARGAVPLMEARGGGSIVTLSYLGSERVFPGYNVMGVAKAGLESTVRYLAADIGPKNIRVNAVSAGPIKTLAAAGIKGFSNILHIYPDRAPLRRNVETSEVAEAAAFLLSDAGKGITGEVLLVDAGFHATGM